MNHQQTEPPADASKAGPDNAGPSQGSTGQFLTEERFRRLSILLILGVLIYVALAPDRLYTPVARTIVFLLAGVGVALLTGVELANRLTLKGPGFAVTLVSATAVAISTVGVLTHLAKAEESVVALDFFDANGVAVPLKYGELTISPMQGPQRLTYAADDGNTVFVVFPSNVAIARVQFQVFGSGMYIGDVRRPAHNRAQLTLGRLNDGVGPLLLAGGSE